MIKELAAEDPLNLSCLHSNDSRHGIFFCASQGAMHEGFCNICPTFLGPDHAERRPGVCRMRAAHIGHISEGVLKLDPLPSRLNSLGHIDHDQNPVTVSLMERLDSRSIRCVFNADIPAYDYMANSEEFCFRCLSDQSIGLYCSVCGARFCSHCSPSGSVKGPSNCYRFDCAVCGTTCEGTFGPSFEYATRFLPTPSSEKIRRIPFDFGAFKFLQGLLQGMHSGAIADIGSARSTAFPDAASLAPLARSFGRKQWAGFSSGLLSGVFVYDDQQNQVDFLGKTKSHRARGGKSLMLELGDRFCRTRAVISYATEEHKPIRQATTAMLERGFDPFFIEPKVNRFDDYWRLRFAEQAAGARLLIAVFSEDYLSREATRDEAELFLDLCEHPDIGLVTVGDPAHCVNSIVSELATDLFEKADFRLERLNELIELLSSLDMRSPH